MMDDSQLNTTSEQPTTTTQNSNSSIVSTSLCRFDVILGAIPLLLGMGVLAGILGPISVQVGVVGAAVASVALLADAMFINPPTDGQPKTTDTQTSTGDEADVGYAAD